MTQYIYIYKEKVNGEGQKMDLKKIRQKIRKTEGQKYIKLKRYMKKREKIQKM